ncbi:carboxylesterase [Bradyrhizobium liaoningense]
MTTKFVYNIDPALTAPFRFVADSGRGVGVVLVHGLNSTPHEMNHVAKRLAEKNISAHSINLRGHSSHPADLLNVSWKNWFDDLSAAVADMRSICDKVVVVGQCAGAVLGLYAATKVAIDGLVLAAPVLRPHEMAQTLGPIAIALGKKYRTWKPKVGEMEGVDWLGYYTQPISVHTEFVALQKEAKARLHLVNARILIIRSRADRISTQPDADTIREQVRGEVSLLELEGSAHLLMLNERVKDTVVATLMSYIEDQFQNGRASDPLSPRR